jgi:phenylalanyl-tRNA synthetase beta chain
MLYLRSWIEDYIDLKGYSDEVLANIITLKSCEVDDVTLIDDYFGGKVVLGKIENTRQHPDADKLKVFELNIGQSKLQLVSGAINVRDNIYVPVALVGCKLPGLTITPRKLRGIESQGMCVGKSELMLEEGFSSGLWEIELNNQSLEQFSPEIQSQFKHNDMNLDNYLGHSICKVLPSLFPYETVLDIKVLPDKFSQIGSHLGMALELAIILENKNLLTEQANQLLTNQDLEIPTNKDIEANFEDSSRYTNSFSLYKVNLDQEFITPTQIQKRMFLTQRNLKGGLIDLSNYLIGDVGQPNHFFETSKLVD